MGTPAKKQKKVEYPIHEMEENGSLILPPHIISQLTYLHSHCGTDEWSGMLLYDVKKGNPSKPKGFELEAKHIFLMDIGTAASTEYETDGDIVDIYDNIPEAMSMKLGHIHTHHSGNAYFSATDMSELNDNVDKHNYYLSLVVCFKGTYSAKVVFLSDMHTTSKMNYKDDSGVMKHFKKTKVEKHMVVIDMNIYFGELAGFFSNRLKQVKGKIEAEQKALAKKNAARYAGGHGTGYGGHHNSHFHNQNMHGLPQHPTHNQRSIDSKIIPDKMTSWEVERLTKNILLFDVNLKAEGNVYAILHQIAKEDDVSLSLFYDYLLNHIEPVTDAFFDEPLTDEEYINVAEEILLCIKKFDGIDALSEVIGDIEQVFDQFVEGYQFQNVTDIEEDEIMKKLAEMEGEIT